MPALYDTASCDVYGFDLYPQRFPDGRECTVSLQGKSTHSTMRITVPNYKMWHSTLGITKPNCAFRLEKSLTEVSLHRPCHSSGAKSYPYALRTHSRNTFLISVMCYSLHKYYCFVARFAIQGIWTVWGSWNVGLCQKPRCHRARKTRCRVYGPV